VERCKENKEILYKQIHEGGKGKYVYSSLIYTVAGTETVYDIGLYIRFHMVQPPGIAL